MCKAPKMKKIETPDPQYLHNPFLDGNGGDEATVNQLRSGKTNLTIPLDTGLGIGFQGRSGGSAGTSGGLGGYRQGGGRPGGGDGPQPRRGGGNTGGGGGGGGMYGRLYSNLRNR